MMITNDFIIINMLLSVAAVVALTAVEFKGLCCFLQTLLVSLIRGNSGGNSGGNVIVLNMGGRETERERERERERARG